MTVTAGSISCPTASRGGRQGLVGTLAAGASPVTPFERLRGPYFGAPMSGIVRFARGILCACSGRGALVQPGPEGPLKYAKVFFHSSVSALCYVKVHIAEHRKFLVLGGGSTRKQKRSVQLINMDNRAYDSSKNEETFYFSFANWTQDRFRGSKISLYVRYFLRTLHSQ